MIRIKIIERTWSEDGAALVRTWYGLGTDLVRTWYGDDLHKLPGS